MKRATDSIRDIIAFPKTQRGQGLMVDAPTVVTEKQMRELHIRLRNPQVAGQRRTKATVATTRKRDSPDRPASVEIHFVKSVGAAIDTTHFAAAAAHAFGARRPAGAIALAALRSHAP